MLELARAGVLALGASVLFTLAVGLIRRYPPAGICLAALIVIPLWEVPSPPPLVTLAGLSVGPADFITLVLFVVGVLEFTQLRVNLQGWLIPWLFLGLLIAVSLLRGAAAFGLGAATNESRGVIWVYFTMTWALATRPDRLRLHTVSLVLGWALVLVALYHGIEYGFGGPTSHVSLGDDGSGRTGRVLVASQAAVLLLCAGTVFMRAPGPGKGHARFTWSSLAFLGVVLFSQHRSVWTAGVLGLTAVLISARGGRARSRAFVLLAGGAWLATSSWVLQLVDPERIASTFNSDTLEWRTSSWQALISDAIARGPVSVVFGEPFGSGFLRKVSVGVVTAVQAHNWYVEIFLRLGVMGLVIIAGMLIAAVLKSRARSSEWMFLLVAGGVYAFAYALDWFLAPWLAAAIVMSLQGCGSAGEAPAPTPSEHPRTGRVAVSITAGSHRR